MGVNVGCSDADSIAEGLLPTGLRVGGSVTHKVGAMDMQATSPGVDGPAVLGLVVGVLNRAHWAIFSSAQLWASCALGL